MLESGLGELLGNVAGRFGCQFRLGGNCARGTVVNNEGNAANNQILDEKPEALRFCMMEVFDRLALHSSGSSNRVVRAMILEEPPLLDAGEITDKGSINQAAVLKRRAALVEELYREPPTARVLRMDGGPR